MSDTAAMRERLFTMRMSEEESSRLEEVSKYYALNAAGVIRMLVKREHDNLRTEATGFGPGPKRAREPAKKTTPKK
ncbi:MAG: hypothetical protein ABI548_07375 [Polyangiaceae bacterium]